MPEIPPSPSHDAPSISGAPTKIGSYTLLDPLGTGGMSSVFRAVHEQSGHEVAVKILPKSLARNPTLLQRFLREAQTAESLQHPSIVEIFDRGSEDGRYYIVLELVPGGDLHDRVRRLGPLPIREALAIIKGVARGLEYAAHEGLIHRDIKPANLLITEDGRVKITDLGLALKAGDEDERVTRDGTTVGTVDFMSPEQARDSRATSVKSDIYSLGCTFYYLLTGQPPFPGGTLPDKLRRHAHEPPPDVREIRPDVPEALAELILRMMAKKPERRFLDYEHLIDALDDLPIPPPVTNTLTAIIDDEPNEPAVMTAVIDDEGEGEAPPGESGPVMTALIDDKDEDAPDAVGPVMTALIDDEGDSGGFTLGPPRGVEPEPGSTRSHSAIPVKPTLPEPAPPTQDWPATPPSLPVVNLSALAGVEEESAPVRRRPPSTPELAGPAPAPRELPARRPPQPGAEPIAILDPVDAEAGMAGPVTQPTQPPPDRTLLILTLRGTLAGLLLAFLGIGIYHLVMVIINRPPAATTGPDRGGKPSVANAGARRPPEAAPPKFARPPWREPAEPEVEPVVPPTFPDALVAGLDLEPARPVAAAPPPGRFVTVERAGVLRDREHVESLALAFDSREPTIVIDDDGPFFESDLKIHRSDRLVRAAEGRRPMVVVGPPRHASVRDRSAMVEIQGASLTFEGIDFVVRAADLPPKHPAPFVVRNGGTLTFRDCTITVEGESDRPVPLAAVQVGLSATTEKGHATVRLERTLVRGDALTAVRLAEGGADIFVTHSAVLAGDAPAFGASGHGSPRSLRLLGSVVATAGPAIELAGSAGVLTDDPMMIRALGTTFARLDGGGKAGSGLVALREVPDRDEGKGSPEQWEGDRNRFDGWPGSPGGAAEPSIEGLDRLRQLASDADSQAEPEPWPASLRSAWTTPHQIADAVPAVKAALSAVADPTPNLRAWTLAAFDRLEPAAPAAAGNVADAAVQRLAFDADAAEWSGDLGRFLVAKRKPDARRVVVRARGIGWKPFSPIRLPEGVGLEIVVEPPASGRPEDRLVWRPREEAQGPALIDVRAADLRIEGAVFERDARTLLGRVVRVEGGRLSLERCILTAPMDVETGGGGLVEFRTEGTRPLDDSGAPPTGSLTDCVLITGGDALTADVGRGVLSLTNCAVAAGASAIALRPQGVARDRFAADVNLERCTIAAVGDFVRLGPWPGSEAGPDRPWIVASRACAFLDRFERRGAPSTAVLLRADPDALAAGALGWQSEADAYEITHFVVAGDAIPRPRSFGDVRSLWVGLWGESHVRNPIDAGSAVQLAAESLDPDKIAPADLAVRTTAGTPPLGADLGPLGLAPSSRDRKPGRPAR